MARITLTSRTGAHFTLQGDGTWSTDSERDEERRMVPRLDEAFGPRTTTDGYAPQRLLSIARQAAELMGWAIATVDLPDPTDPEPPAVY